MDNGYKITNPELRNDYGVEKRYGISLEERHDLVRQFNSSAFMGFLPSLRDSIHYVRKLHEEEGFTFKTCTSMSKDKNAQKLRKMNIRKLFGRNVFDEYIFLGCGEDKTAALEPFRNSGYLWVEDKLENAIIGRNLGMDAVLISHGHNQGDHGIPRYANWKGIYNRIIGE